MTRKRKTDAARLDEVDRTLYSNFCSAANSLSQVYAQAMSHQKIAFQVGERHALEKLYQWIVRQHEEGSRVTTADIITHLQNEIDYGGDDSSTSPRVQFPYQHMPANMHSTHATGGLDSTTPPGQPAVRLVPRVSQHHSSDQAKNSVFSNALSSPVRRSLQSYQMAAQGDGYYSSDNLVGSASGAQRQQDRSSPPRDIQDSDSPTTSMDINSDGPDHAPY